MTRPKPRNAAVGPPRPHAHDCETAHIAPCRRAFFCGIISVSWAQEVEPLPRIEIAEPQTTICPPEMGLCSAHRFDPILARVLSCNGGRTP